MRKMTSLLLVLALVLSLCGSYAVAATEITVGIVNNPPSESGYRAANVKDFETVFTAANGYAVKTFYSIKNDEQLAAAQQFITDGRRTTCSFRPLKPPAGTAFCNLPRKPA